MDNIYNVLLWGTGIVFQRNIQLIKFLESQSMISVVAITSNDKIYANLFGYSFIEKKNISVNELNKVIIMATDSTYDAIHKEAIEIGFVENDLIPIKVVGLAGFDIAKYERLKCVTPTIFASNCWGGITYNTLGLKFNSPFINMFIEEEDYIKFLKKPKYYINCQLQYYESRYNKDINIEYPVALCDDIKLFFNHYSSYEDAEKCWERRKERINWDNIFVMHYTTNLEMVDKFVDLEYEKGICFTNKEYKVTDKNVITINYSDDETFYNVVNRFAKGEITYYSPFDLLLYGHSELYSKLL